MRNNVIGFYRPDEEYGYLSNWYPAVFEYAEKKYSSTEQFMMAQKAMIFHDYAIYYRIMEESDLDKIKALGKKVKNYDDALWAKLRQPIMRRGVRAKFQQNPVLLNQLLGTGNKVLAECAPRDKIWGIGMGLSNKRVQLPTEWNGYNLLGTTLMQVRSDLRRWIAVSANNVSYIDACNLEANEVWSMYISEVRKLPEYSEALDIYASIVDFQLKDVPFSFDECDGTLEDIETSMRTNMGGGLPAAWFWEMKQDFYDIARFGG